MDDVEKSTLFREQMCKFETPHYHRHIRGCNENRDIFCGGSHVKTHLCDRKMPCSSYQTHDDSEVIISSRALRSSSDVKTWCAKWQNWPLAEDRFIQVLIDGKHLTKTTTSFRCQLGSRKTGKLFYGSMSKSLKTQQILAPEERPSKASRSPGG